MYEFCLPHVHVAFTNCLGCLGNPLRVHYKTVKSTEGNIKKGSLDSAGEVGGISPGTIQKWGICGKGICLKSAPRKLLGAGGWSTLLSLYRYALLGGF